MKNSTHKVIRSSFDEQPTTHTEQEKLEPVTFRTTHARRQRSKLLSQELSERMCSNIITDALVFSYKLEPTHE